MSVLALLLRDIHFLLQFSKRFITPTLGSDRKRPKMQIKLFEGSEYLDRSEHLDQSQNLLENGENTRSLWHCMSARVCV